MTHLGKGEYLSSLYCSIGWSSSHHFFRSDQI